MRIRRITLLTAALLLPAAILLIFTACSRRGMAAELPAPPLPAASEPVPAPDGSPLPAQIMMPASTTTETPIPTEIPTPTPTEAPMPTPQRAQWTLSFAGDCTIGTLHAWQGSPAPLNMLRVMNGDWSYPFSGVASVFTEDDFTMVNLEGTFTELNTPKGKDYCFKGPPEAAQTLVSGGIEAVSLANNHSRDYGEQSLADTRASLEACGILWADNGVPLIFDLPDGGPRLGIIAYNCVETSLPAGSVDAYMRECEGMYDACVDAGCDLVAAYLHWGWEYRSEPEQWMVDFAHRLAELGCDLVVGSHPHILQRFESRDGTPVCYSLGNFCFGGHSGPADMDSVILRQTVVRTQDGYALGDTVFLPCSISSVTDRNDYRPSLCAPDSAAYGRVLEKLGLSSAATEK